MSDSPKPPDDQAIILVALQDLDMMIKETEDKKTASEMKEMGFQMDNITALRQARDAMAQRVKPQLLNRYERVSQNYDRAVVPVAGELCLGCFARIPTSFRSLHNRANTLTCENCGRILYFA